MSNLKKRIMDLEKKIPKNGNEPIIVHWDEPGELIKIDRWERRLDESEDSFVSRVKKLAADTMENVMFLWGEVKGAADVKGSFSVSNLSHEEALDQLA